MVFGGSAARSSAIGTANFEEGMVSYLTDTDKVEAYNGTNWVSVAPTTSQGLTLINTTSFSGVASQSINDVFSATYDNYRIIARINGTSNGAILTYQNRVSGTNAATNYGFQEIEANTNSGNPTASRATSQTSTRVGKVQNSLANSIDTMVYGPFLAEATSLFSNNYFDVPAITIYGSQHTTATSYTGFTIGVTGGNITGSISVFGVAK
jgi:hypothetical protein